jgi:chemotaxis protein MotB
MAENQAPIIIVRKKAGHGGHHSGAWKVAYADFVTAMMAFFMVLWLMNSSQKVQEAVGAYFRDPTGRGKMSGSSVAGSGAGIAISKNDMGDLKSKLQQAMSQMPKFEQLKDQVSMTVTGEGLRVELLETDHGMFFDSGSPRPSSNGEELLLLLAKELGRLPNQLLIEGHTDAKPFTGATQYSNWELSTERANSSRRLMEANGLRDGQIVQVRGYADRQLRSPESPEDPSNRRVTVIVKYLDPGDVR